MNTIAYDVGTLLGLGAPNGSPIIGREDVVAVRISSGISLVGIQRSPAGRAKLLPKTWFPGYEWAQRPLDPGTYHLRVPVPGSRRKSYAAQRTLLHHHEMPIPVTLAVLAMLCGDATGLPDMIGGAYLRCMEATIIGQCVEVHWQNGLLSVDYRDPRVESAVVLLGSATGPQ